MTKYFHTSSRSKLHFAKMIGYHKIELSYYEIKHNVEYLILWQFRKSALTLYNSLMLVTCSKEEAELEDDYAKKLQKLALPVYRMC